MSDTNARLDGKVVIVTGGSAGIGLAAAKNLANRGARVVIASRNEAKLQNARDEIIAATGNNDIAYRIIDLESLRSVRNFVRETVKVEKSVDVLVNNAGAIGLPDRLTDDGLILPMQVNYFGIFLLTYLLIPKMKLSAPSRIINNSAASKYFGDKNFEHWNDVGRHSAVSFAANSQIAITLFTAELNRRFEETGVTVNTFDPFIVRNTDLFNSLNTSERIKNLLRMFYNTVGQSQEAVANQIGYLASEPSLEKVSGKNYLFGRSWINPCSVRDAKLTRKLWEFSKEAVKITADEDWEMDSMLITAL